MTSTLPTRTIVVILLSVALATVFSARNVLTATGMVQQPGAGPASSLAQAQHLFYGGFYGEAVAAAADLRTTPDLGLAAYELRTSALHFQLKRAMGELADREKAFKQCGVCPDLLAQFLRDTTAGRALAKTHLEATPQDNTTLFFLGKIDLNYVWLQLGTLGKRTGWGEYWEARRSLDAVLKSNPAHVRARVARAWIDYIVDTRGPRGFRWVLGGGNKKNALAAIREAAATESDFYTKAEAGFGLWEMQVREKDFANAIDSARRLQVDFPQNRDLAKFLDAHKAATR